MARCQLGSPYVFFRCVSFFVVFHDTSVCFGPFGFAPFRFSLQRISSVNLSISSPLQVSGAVTRLTVYRAATHSQTALEAPKRCVRNIQCGGAVNRQPGYRARNLQRRGNRKVDRGNPLERKTKRSKTERTKTNLSIMKDNEKRNATEGNVRTA